MATMHCYTNGVEQPWVQCVCMDFNSLPGLIPLKVNSDIVIPRQTIDGLSFKGYTYDNSYNSVRAMMSNGECMQPYACQIVKVTYGGTTYNIIANDNNLKRSYSIPQTNSSDTFETSMYRSTIFPKQSTITSLDSTADITDDDSTYASHMWMPSLYLEDDTFSGCTLYKELLLGFFLQHGTATESDILSLMNSSIYFFDSASDNAWHIASNGADKYDSPEDMCPSVANPVRAWKFTPLSSSNIYWRRIYHSEGSTSADADYYYYAVTLKEPALKKTFSSYPSIAYTSALSAQHFIFMESRCIYLYG